MVQLSKQFLLRYDAVTSVMYLGHLLFCVYLCLFLITVRNEISFDYALISTCYWVLMIFINTAQAYFHNTRKNNLMNYGDYALWELQFSEMNQYCYWQFLYRLLLLLLELMAFISILVVTLMHVNMNFLTLVGIYHLQAVIFITLHGIRILYRVPVFIVLNVIISTPRAAPFFPFLKIDIPNLLILPSIPPPEIHTITFQSELHSVDVCSICHENYNETKPMSFLNSCRHLYHTDCIQQWFTGGGRICPLCGN